MVTSFTSIMTQINVTREVDRSVTSFTIKVDISVIIVTIEVDNSVICVYIKEDIRIINVTIEVYIIVISAMIKVEISVINVMIEVVPGTVLLCFLHVYHYWTRKQEFVSSYQSKKILSKTKSYKAFV